MPLSSETKKELAEVLPVSASEIKEADLRSNDVRVKAQTSKDIPSQTQKPGTFKVGENIPSNQTLEKNPSLRNKNFPSFEIPIGQVPQKAKAALRRKEEQKQQKGEVEDANIKVGPIRDSKTGKIVDANPDKPGNQKPRKPDKKKLFEGETPGGSKVEVTKTKVGGEETLVIGQEKGDLPPAEAVQRALEEEARQVGGIPGQKFDEIAGSIQEVQRKARSATLRPGEDGALQITGRKEPRQTLEEERKQERLEKIESPSEKVEKVKESRAKIQNEIKQLGVLPEDKKVKITTRKGETLKVSSQTAQNILSERLETLPRFTKEGEQFLAQEENLQELPSLPQLKNQPIQKISQGKIPFTPSVTGELVEEGIIGQFRESGQTFIDLTGVPGEKETGQQDPTETIFGEGEGLVSGEGKPQKQFVEQLPELSVSQQRAQEFLKEQTQKRTTSKQRKKLTEAARRTAFSSTEEVLTAAEETGLVGKKQAEKIRESQRNLISRIPSFVVKEIPEKTTELAALSGVAAETVKNPQEVAFETGLGAKELAGSIKEDPVGFGVGEVATDIGVDIVTGGGAAVAVPQTRKIQVPDRAGRAIKEFKDLRQGAKQQPDLLTAAAEQAALKRPEQQALTVDTVEPEPGPTTQPDLVEPEPTQFETLDIIQGKTETESIPLETRLGVATGVTGGFNVPESQTIADSRPKAEATAKGRPIGEDITITESQAVAQPLAETVPVPESIAISEPVPEVVPEPVPEVVPEPVPLANPKPEEDNDEKGFLDSLIAPKKDVKFDRSLAADLLGIEGEVTAEKAEQKAKKQGQTRFQNPLSLRAFEEKS